MRIVITGAESSGKSTLTEHLGRTLKLPYALEYARYYLEHYGPDYDLAQLTRLSKLHQQYQQTEVSCEVALGIFDTDLINYKIWAEVVFGCCPEVISAGIAQESSHVYLLCKPDLPWEPDPLRQNPDDREQLYQRHLQEIQRLGRPFEIVEGSGAQRLANADAAVERLITKQTA
ncbi:ATP-binding protein [uncultured Amphritea sp.]|uniref:ATP-binding protein n=1 Tax=uncultured Amphritea sp. TaxID=981605 RepID=UPI002631E8FC|nr:ATP-binding protein [uncultured Amphritea sp.]